MSAASRQRLAQVLADPRPDLAEANLLMASEAYPRLDLGAQLDRVDWLADEAGRLGGTVDAVAAALRAAVLRGDREDYDDPRNSFLNEVLDRRVGIPISLAVLGMEVGRRIGVPVWGVGLPGHFIVRDKVDPRVFIDPFHGGRQLDAAACRALHRATLGASVPWDESYLEPVGRPAIVARMLANLRGIYERRTDLDSLRWVMRLTCALPDATEADRRVYARLMAPLN